MSDCSFSTNILILGKTGVGKSALLNYLFGDNKAPTDTGRPVTGAGIFEYEPFNYEGLWIKIHDSWGLEPDKAHQWIQIIRDEIKKHDTEEIKDWFHTIIYCVDCKRARIEDFEVENVINALAKEGNRLVFALTRADVALNEEKAATSRVLYEICSDFPQVEICSVGRVLRGGQEVSPFGRDKLIRETRRNLRENLLYKALHEFFVHCGADFASITTDIIDYFVQEAGDWGIFKSYDDFLKNVQERMRRQYYHYFITNFEKLMGRLVEINRIEYNYIYYLSNHKPGIFKKIFQAPQEFSAIKFETAIKDGFSDWLVSKFSILQMFKYEERLHELVQSCDKVYDTIGDLLVVKVNRIHRGWVNHPQWSMEQVVQHAVETLIYMN